jgi:hypothetical protein
MALAGALYLVVHAATGFTYRAFAGGWPDSLAMTTAPRRRAMPYVASASTG